MGYSSGNFSYSGASTNFSAPVTGTTISSSSATACFNETATALSTCILKDGTQTITAAIPFASNRITGLGAATARTDAIQFAQVQDGTPQYLTSVAGTNTITATAANSMTAYAVGQRFWLVPAVTNTGATTLNINSIGAGAVQSAGAGLQGGELVATVPVQIEVTATTPVFQIVGGGQIQVLVDTSLCQGRLTLTTGTPVTTGDVTAATTLYFTPYKGNRVALYTGSLWKLYPISEVSVAVPATTNTVYDVFLYDNAGTMALDLVAWTNDTTRATALATQNGVYVKTAATSRRYVGSFRTTGSSGQTEDSIAKRYVWNYYNRIARTMRAVDVTNSWTYTTLTYRQANANAANQLDFVVGVSEDEVWAQVIGIGGNATADISIASGIGLDSTSANSAQIIGHITTPGGTAENYEQVVSVYQAPIAVGRHTLVWLELSEAGGTTTWLGDGNVSYVQSGISGRIFG